MIRSFGDAATEELFHGHRTRRVLKYPKRIIPGALRKLDMINSAKELGDLRAPPGNRLEALKGDLAGFHSIRINDQWRVIFRWENREAREVRIIDYHS